MEREKAPIGVLLTLEPPTRPMERAAASAGFYGSVSGEYPRWQIITIEQALKRQEAALDPADRQRGGYFGARCARRATISTSWRYNAEQKGFRCPSTLGRLRRYL